MQIKHITRIALTALFLAWSFDQLFWRKFPGVSFLVFTLLCLGAGLILTRTEKRRPRRSSLVLLVPLLFFASMTALRLEPFTRLVSFGLTLGLMFILTLSWLGGGWWQYNLRDYLHNSLRWLGLVVARPAQVYERRRRATSSTETTDERLVEHPAGGGRRTVLSVLLGLLLALPLLVFLGLLLASADPVFAREIRSAFEILRLENLAEYGFRLAYVLVLAYALTGVLIYALLASRREQVSAGDGPLIPPFLAWLTAATILLCVDALFLGFVAVQFRYFFGGVVNIGIDGMTYAQYARRGFAELVLVALISLVVFLGLSAFTRRSPKWQRRIFSGLGLGLAGLVVIMLASAFQRLFLYESTFGFSRLRTYSHIFMIWLGVLLAGIVLLEIRGKLNYLPLALVVVGIGFGASLALVNVDGLIVRQNVTRAAQGFDLDTAYLTGLSDDAVPGLFALYESPDLPQELREQVGGVLACRLALRGDEPRTQAWPSFHLSHWQADRVYAEHQGELDGDAVKRDGYRWYVAVGQRETSCQDHSW